MASAPLLDDVAFTTIDSPIGRVLLARTSRGLVRIVFAHEDFGHALDLLESRSSGVHEDRERLTDSVGEFSEYFAGQRRTFGLPLDFSLSAGFRRRVQEALPRIPYGQTRSYAEVAALVGNPRAVRAVGTSCARNPLPIVVPCHRVVRSDGSLGGYAYGLKIKEELLKREVK